MEKEVKCTVRFSGLVTKEQLYVILDHIDDMKKRGYELVRNERTELNNGEIRINYVLLIYKP